MLQLFLWNHILSFPFLVKLQLFPSLSSCNVFLYSDIVTFSESQIVTFSDSYIVTYPTFLPSVRCSSLSLVSAKANLWTQPGRINKSGLAVASLIPDAVVLIVAPLSAPLFHPASSFHSHCATRKRSHDPPCRTGLFPGEKWKLETVPTCDGLLRRRHNAPKAS